MEWLRIGEVAARTGLTPRTLRHYDGLGLLVPSGRTDGDYRLYSRDDMDRLLAIQHLKSLGLGLAEIQQALDDPTFDAGPLLERHARVVEQRIAAEQALLRRLRQLQTAAQTGWDEVLETIALSERLRHPDGEVRFRAALTGHASAPVEDLVERLRSDPEPGVREAATWALAHVLGKLRTIEALPQLSLLLTDDVPEVAAKAAFSLGQVGGDEAVQLLIGALEDDRVAVRDEATSALGRLPESLASLTAAASHPLPQVRAQVTEALGFLAHPEAVPVLIAALEDDDADVRFSALLALGSAEGPEARRALEALTAAPDRRTSLVAARLLEARPLS